MKHPLAFTIATVAVFALMGAVILSGELRFGPPPEPATTLHIASVKPHCPQSIDADVAGLPSQDAMVAALKASCDGRAMCEIDTTTLYKDDPTPNCTEEILIDYYCLADAGKTYFFDETERHVFLYEGQRATLQCE